MPANAAYRFFISYASQDRDNANQVIGPGNNQISSLTYFVNRLMAEVATLCGKNVEPGFFDQGRIEVGDSWPDALVSGLQGARVLVCLWSASYFSSAMCGKELAIFRRRIELANNKQVPLIVPLLWTPATSIRAEFELSDEFWNLQYSNPNFPPAYRQHGISGLTKGGQDIERLNEMARLVAERIQQLSNAHSLPVLAEPIDVKLAASAFEGGVRLRAAKVTAGSAGMASRSKRGPRSLRFVYAVGTTSEIRGIKKDASSYGEDGRDWQPFSGYRPVGLTAQRSADKINCYCENLSCGKNTIDEIRKAEEENTPVVIITDHWSSHIPIYRNFLSAYDRMYFCNSSVLEPQPSIAPDPVDSLQYDSEILHKILHRKSRFNSELHRFNISSHGQFDADLDHVIADLQTQILKLGQPAKAVLGSGPTALPTLDVPVGSSAPDFK